MKKILSVILCISLALTCLLGLTSCGKEPTGVEAYDAACKSLSEYFSALAASDENLKAISEKKCFESGYSLSLKAGEETVEVSGSAKENTETGDSLISVSTPLGAKDLTAQIAVKAEKEISVFLPEATQYFIKADISEAINENDEAQNIDLEKIINDIASAFDETKTDENITVVKGEDNTKTVTLTLDKLTTVSLLNKIKSALSSTLTEDDAEGFEEGIDGIKVSFELKGDKTVKTTAEIIGEEGAGSILIELTTEKDSDKYVYGGKLSLQGSEEYDGYEISFSGENTPSKDGATGFTEITLKDTNMSVSLKSEFTSVKSGDKTDTNSSVMVSYSEGGMSFSYTIPVSISSVKSGNTYSCSISASTSIEETDYSLEGTFDITGSDSLDIAFPDEPSGKAVTLEDIGNSSDSFVSMMTDIITYYPEITSLLGSVSTPGADDGTADSSDAFYLTSTDGSDEFVFYNTFGVYTQYLSYTDNNGTVSINDPNGTYSFTYDPSLSKQTVTIGSIEFSMTNSDGYISLDNYEEEIYFFLMSGTASMEQYFDYEISDTDITIYVGADDTERVIAYTEDDNYVYLDGVPYIYSDSSDSSSGLPL